MRGGVTLVVAEKTSRLPVDHRLSLRIYYRAADSILRQARIYRQESNLIDLYVLLLRFSSLVMETVPQHRDYRDYLGREKLDFRKRVLDVLNELETLKPLVQVELFRYNNVEARAASFSTVSSTTAAAISKSVTRSQSLPGTREVKAQGYAPAGQSLRADPSVATPSVVNNAELARGSTWNVLNSNQSSLPGRQAYPQITDSSSGYGFGRYGDSQNHGHPLPALSSAQTHNGGPGYAGAAAGAASAMSLALPPAYSSSLSSVDDGMSRVSLRMPSSDTMSRHSFLASSTKSVTVGTAPSYKVKYPSLNDWTPPATSSLDNTWRSLAPPSEDPVPAQLSQGPMTERASYSEADMIKFDDVHSDLVNTAVSMHSQLNRQPSPPPVAAEVKVVPAPPQPQESHPAPAPVASESYTSSLLEELNPQAGHVEHVEHVEPVTPPQITEDRVQSRVPKSLHISLKLMDSFLRVADGNTRGNLETCGVLAGTLREGIFYVTTLIIPKQEGTSNSCNTIHEEDIYEYQDKNDLFQFGWIHTHPSQSCFMSSIDLHTHYSYQVMLPEAVAIVMAPTDPSRKYGIFRLAEPSGINVIQTCDLRGFHAHAEPKGGIYEQCGHVLLDPKLTCDVVDLR